MSVRVGARVAPRTGVRKLRRPVASAAAPSFNPLTSWTTDPVHGVWASDPLWTPPADGGAVSSWRNGGSVGGDLVQATGSKRPTYDTALAAYNDQPVVTFATDDVLAVDVADIAAPYHVLLIGNTSGSGVAAERLFSPIDLTNTGLGDGGAHTWQWFATGVTGASGGTTNASPHLFRAVNGGAGANQITLRVDEAAALTGTATASLTHLILGSSTVAGSNLLTGSIALLLIFNTDPTALPEWSDFKAWCLSFYGITVA